MLIKSIEQPNQCINYKAAFEWCYYQVISCLLISNGWFVVISSESSLAKSMFAQVIRMEKQFMQSITVDI